VLRNNFHAYHQAGGRV